MKRKKTFLETAIPPFLRVWITTRPLSLGLDPALQTLSAWPNSVHLRWNWQISMGFWNSPPTPPLNQYQQQHLTWGENVGLGEGRCIHLFHWYPTLNSDLFSIYIYVATRLVTKYGSDWFVQATRDTTTVTHNSDKFTASYLNSTALDTWWYPLVTTMRWQEK